MGATIFAVTLACFLAVIGVGTAAAQNFSGLGTVDASGTSYYRFVRPGEATVEVLLLGNTGRNGIYVVGFDTDLAEFLALSGTTFGQSSENQRVNVTVKLYRQQGTERDLVFEAPVEDALAMAANVPIFNDGDIIYIETRSRTRFSWYTIIRSASSIASLVLLAERLIRLAR